MYHGVVLRNPITFSIMIYTSIQTTEQSKTKGLKLKLHLLQFDLFPVDYIFLRKFSDKTLKHSSHINCFWLLVLNVVGLKTNFQNHLSIRLLLLSYSIFSLNHISCIIMRYCSITIATKIEQQFRLKRSNDEFKVETFLMWLMRHFLWMNTS